MSWLTDVDALSRLDGSLTSSNGVSCVGDGYIETVGGWPSLQVGGTLFVIFGLIALLLWSRPEKAWEGKLGSTRTVTTRHPIEGGWYGFLLGLGAAAILGAIVLGAASDSDSRVNNATLRNVMVMGGAMAVKSGIDRAGEARITEGRHDHPIEPVRVLGEGLHQGMRGDGHLDAVLDVLGAERRGHGHDLGAGRGRQPRLVRHHLGDGRGDVGVDQQQAHRAFVDYALVVGPTGTGPVGG